MKTIEPLVTVVIPTFNRANSIKYSIESVINQSYQNIELIVIDDGSTDNTKEILSSYIKDEKIIYVKNKNLGVCHARNNGMKIAKGEYIAFLDSDDTFFFEKIKSQLEVMQSKKIKISISGCIKKQEEESISIQETESNYSVIVTKKNIIQGKFSLSASLIMIRNHNPLLFDERLPSSNDFDFILRYLAKEKCLFVSQNLVIIYKTLGGNRISSNYLGKLNGYKKVLKKLENQKYELSLEETNLLEKKLYSEIGFFSILLKKNKEGRMFLQKSFAYKELHFRYYIVFILSYIPFSISVVKKIAKFFWSKGVFKL